MVVALIAAMGAVVVAVVAIIGSRIEARDARSRLAKDVEILSKLDKESSAREVLEQHIAESTSVLVTEDRRRRAYRGILLTLLIALGCLFSGIAIDIALGGAQHASVMSALRQLGQSLRPALFVGAVLAAVLLAFVVKGANAELKRSSAGAEVAEPPHTESKPGNE